MILCPFVSMAGDLPDIKIQMLDSEIEKLTRERDEKYAILQECAKNVKGFKIAGITTLTAAGVGVYANIRLAQKLNEKSLGGSEKNGLKTDTRTEEQKAAFECEMFCADGEAPEGCNC